MKITKKPCRGESCNFCRRGVSSAEGVGLIFPYNEVYECETDSLGGLSVRACERCIKQLVNYFTQDTSLPNPNGNDYILAETGIEGSSRPKGVF